MSPRHWECAHSVMLRTYSSTESTASRPSDDRSLLPFQVFPGTRCCVARINCNWDSWVKNFPAGVSLGRVGLFRACIGLVRVLESAIQIAIESQLKSEPPLDS